MPIAPRIEFFFSDFPEPQLERVRFQHPLLNAVRTTVRGRTTGAQKADGTFMWSAAVQALALLFVRYLRYQAHPCEDHAVLVGTQGSPASSLDFAINKQTVWIQDMFGTDSAGVSIINRLIRRTNVHSKRAIPVRVSVQSSALPADSVQFYINERRITSESSHTQLQDAIEQCLAPAPRATRLTRTTNFSRNPASPMPSGEGHAGFISLGRLPSTSHELVGRDAPLSLLRQIWSEGRYRVVVLVAFGGVGKTALVNHWLRELAAGKFADAASVFGYSFHSQGVSIGKQTSGEDFIAQALAQFSAGTADSQTPWQRGERLATLVGAARNLVILDGLEPLQHAPGGDLPGRLKDSGLNAFLRSFAYQRNGLCVVTTRVAVEDLQEFWGSSVLQIDLERLSPQSGATLLRNLGVNGENSELLKTSEEYEGHPLALTLLARYLALTYHGRVSERAKVRRLFAEPKHGGHARRVMAAYEGWFAGRPEQQILLLLGLFDRPIPSRLLNALLRGAPLPGLTDHLVGLSHEEWMLALANLRDARLLSGPGEDAHDILDCHPLVREHFAQRGAGTFPEQWREAHSRLFDYFSHEAPPKPETFEAMTALFRAIEHGGKAVRYADCFRLVYYPRIMRGEEQFAGKRLFAYESVLSALGVFFPPHRWDVVLDQDLTSEERAILAQHASLYLTLTRGYAAEAVREANELALSLHSNQADTPMSFGARYGLWRYYFVRQELGRALELATAMSQKSEALRHPVFHLAAERTLGSTHFFRGEFTLARRHSREGVQLCGALKGCESSQGFLFPAELLVGCYCYDGLSAWHLGHTRQAERLCKEALALARESSDPHSTCVALYLNCFLQHFTMNYSAGALFAEELFQLSSYHALAWWRASGRVLRGWFGFQTEGNYDRSRAEMNAGFREWHLTGSRIAVPFLLTLSAEMDLSVGHHRQALALAEEALKKAHQGLEMWWVADTLRVRSECRHALSEVRASLEDLSAAKTQAEALGSKGLLSRMQRAHSKAVVHE